MFRDRSDDIRIEVLTSDNWRRWAPALRELESAIEYPYGRDTFRIDHGPDYWKFFARLGEPRMHAVVGGERILAVACGILRSLQDGPAWYLCDLKSAADFRGQHAATRMLKHQFFRNYWRCHRGYAISMNPQRGENRIARLLDRFSWLPFHVEAELKFFTFSHSTVAEVRAAVESVVGPLGMADLRGMKDLIMGSTGRSMPVVHLQYGQSIQQPLRVIEGVEFMLAVVAGSAIDARLNDLGVKASATASVIAHRMRGVDFGFVMSSDV